MIQIELNRDVSKAMQSIIINGLTEGKSIPQIAKEHSISATTLYEFCHREGILTKLPFPRGLTPSRMQEVVDFIKQNPHETIANVRKKYDLTRHQYSFIRNHFTLSKVGLRQSVPKLSAKQQAILEYTAKYPEATHRETGTQVGVTRAYVTAFLSRWTKREDVNTNGHH